MNTPKITAQERKWRAQEDLRTLAAAQDIRSDRARLSAAKAEATKVIKAVGKPVARKRK